MSDSPDGAPPFTGAPDAFEPAPPEQPPDSSAVADELADAAFENTVANPYDATPDAASDPYPGAVPPGYDWPTHGGYLGCVMGVVVGLVLGGFLGSFLIGLLSVSPLAGLVSGAAGRITLLALAFFATLIAAGRVGYRLGRRYYREYPQPERGRLEEEG
ncbi:MAG TPA: hypothetical protein VGR57_03745 [Ktedonobacterales bacterium]|nr:hypothetical protein [Ktedonobacterales bacterium]